ncbi:hypothetical protein GDO81_001822 [Engystomops pustulosus]|uniref:Olfactory receptor n=1 Tax=Engystomops pustulosus TaxID=76066 RepID=A0AAV7DFM9_ENGPU|nr:hypothetical protein GDO81_001822 [Engystomops pustulosus]
MDQGFPGSFMFHVIMFTVLLLVYIVTLVGNVFVAVLICSDYRLHSPMYFFLVCFSVVETILSSSVDPKLLVILITGEKAISRVGCFAQSYIFYFISITDFLLLTVMSIDRCVAICYPLRYSSIMTKSVCISLMTGCLIPPFITLFYPTIIIANLSFCDNVLNHFFCESAAMLKLSCVDITSLKLNTILSSVLILIGCLIITTISYIIIVATIIRMPTGTGRQKTFSTCGSHLTMLSLVFGSAIFIVIRPPKEYSVETDKIVNLVSTVLAPLLNPFIYTLKNEKVKECVQDKIRRKFFI